MLDLEVKGLRELDTLLAGLPDKLRANILRGALNAAGKEIAEEARRLAPVQTGTLRDSIRVSTRLVRGTTNVEAKVKVGGKQKGKRSAFYARFIEFGTAAHIIRGRNGPLKFNGTHTLEVAHPGVKKKPFMRPALDARLPSALEAFRERLRKRMTKEGINLPEEFLPAEDDE